MQTGFHTTLYEWLTSLEGANGLETRQRRRWNGRHGEIWSYRFVNQVPLRAGDDAMMVNWFELTITHEETGKVHLSQCLGHQSPLTQQVKMYLSWLLVGRARWKVENENINVLKTKGYNLNHNFGHGETYLANVFFTLNLLAFLGSYCSTFGK